VPTPLHIKQTQSAKQATPPAGCHMSRSLFLIGDFPDEVPEGLRQAFDQLFPGGVAWRGVPWPREPSVHRLQGTELTLIPITTA